MGNDAEWIDDVQRWYYGGTPPAADSEFEGGTGADDAALGYEAAHPALQARHWPDAPAAAKVLL